MSKHKESDGGKTKGLFNIFSRVKPVAKRSPLAPTPTAAVMAAPEVVRAADAAEASLSSSAFQLHAGPVFAIALDGSIREEVVIPKGMSAVPAKTADGKAVLHLTGGDLAAPSSGHTGGFSVRVPDSIEAAASGKRVRLTVSARASSGFEMAEFWLAYSTNEVGNSGWRKFTAGNQFEPKSFDYDVPAMKDGCGDFVGILPASSRGVEIETLKVEVIPRS